MIQNVGFNTVVLKAVAGGPQARISTSYGKIKSSATTVAVHGMTCGACTSTIENKSKDLEAMYQFNISLLTSCVVVAHNLAELSADHFTRVVR